MAANKIHSAIIDMVQKEICVIRWCWHRTVCKAHQIFCQKIISAPVIPLSGGRINGLVWSPSEEKGECRDNSNHTKILNKWPQTQICKRTSKTFGGKWMRFPILKYAWHEKSGHSRRKWVSGLLLMRHTFRRLFSLLLGAIFFLFLELKYEQWGHGNSNTSFKWYFWAWVRTCGTVRVPICLEIIFTSFSPYLSKQKISFKNKADMSSYRATASKYKECSFSDQ